MHGLPKIHKEGTLPRSILQHKVGDSMLGNNTSNLDVQMCSEVTVVFTVLLNVLLTVLQTVFLIVLKTVTGLFQSNMTSH